MKVRLLALVLCAVLIPSLAHAQSLVLDSASSSLATIPATTADVLEMGIPSDPGPGPLGPPIVGLKASTLGLLAGDVVDALSFGDDFGAIGIDALYFSVDRAALGPGAGPFPPDVFSETNPPTLPPGIQGEASSDVFVTSDPAAGIGLGLHTQVLDGDGLVTGP